MNAVAGWTGAPRPVLARELLPERALLGDATAIAALEAEVMRPLADAGPALGETLDAYLDSGGAIEACARKLFVHPNTVRYRLKRIADFTGRDPTLPRDAYVLRVGRHGRQAQPSATPFQHAKHRRRAGDGGHFEGPGSGTRGVIDYGEVSMESHHMLFCGLPTKT